jgi:hypothetical protein
MRRSSQRRSPLTRWRTKRSGRAFPPLTVRSQTTVPTLGDFFKIKAWFGHWRQQLFHPERRGNESSEAYRLNAFDLSSLAHAISTPIKSRPTVRAFRCLPDAFFLLDVKLTEEDIKRRYPPLDSYLQEGRTRGLHERYLCQHRALWYAQEDRPTGPDCVHTISGAATRKMVAPSGSS